MKKEEQRPSNPSAFPVTATEQSYHNQRPLMPESGMTLRDYFAAKEDVSELVNSLTLDRIYEIMNVSELPKGFENMIFWFELEAKVKFMKADAMLKQREL